LFTIALLVATHVSSSRIARCVQNDAIPNIAERPAKNNKTMPMIIRARRGRSLTLAAEGLVVRDVSAISEREETTDAGSVGGCAGG
jgi:hypothetical protein